MKNDYVIVGDEVLVDVGKGRTMVIDLADLPTIQQVTHSVHSCLDARERTAYAMIREPLAPGGSRKIHRIILDAPRGTIVDHIDHDGLNNKRSNLRLVTQSQNQQNRPRANRNSKSGVRGVYFHDKRGKWVATCNQPREGQRPKLIWLGQFDTLEAATAAAVAGRALYMTHSNEKDLQHVG